MNARNWIAGVAVAAGLGVAGLPAFAAVITFDGVSPGVGSHPVTSPYVELTYAISAPGGLYYLGTGDVRYAGENNLFDSNYDDVTTLTTTGKPFDIQSIDLAEMYFPPAPADEPTTFIGTLRGGTTVTQTFDVNNLTFQTYDFGARFADLTSLSWTSTGAYTPQFAHIVLSPVPEPATWAMMLVGFLGLGAVLRGQRRKPALAAASPS